MWTIEYKGFYIHGYCNQNACSINFPWFKVALQVKSLHAAKCRITRYINTA